MTNNVDDFVKNLGTVSSSGKGSASAAKILQYIIEANAKNEPIWQGKICEKMGMESDQSPRLYSGIKSLVRNKAIVRAQSPASGRMVLLFTAQYWGANKAQLEKHVTLYTGKAKVAPVADDDREQ